VQHHQAHVAVVQAEHGFTREPLVGWALDGVGLGEDGQAWGGELLVLQSGQARRLNHLAPLRLPGGDAAAREPWRLAAAVLWASGRGAEAVERFGAQLGTDKVRGILRMLDRDLNCPSSSAAGRWFDAAAGMLGLNLQQAHEAEAAQALEAAATAWRTQGQVLPPEDPDVTTAALERLDLHPMVDALADEPDAARGAARFQGVLAQALVRAGTGAAQAEGVRHIALTGGCCFNRLLMAQLSAGFGQAGLDVLRPAAVSPGDAGLALGQAWAAALRVASV
jgi:hydrogenase maturation protein HypF